MKQSLQKTFFALLLAILPSIMLLAQPKAEIRAVWLTTNGGSDWPKGSYTESTQKSRLITILDKLQAANFNTIILQVQVKGDVAWDSKIQPTMYDFTGDGRKKLSWDICGYVIEECHKRNMECHAWIVPYRVGTASEANRYSANAINHVSKLRPELCVSYNGAFYLDPGLPEVRSYLIDLYRELITNYDFDGTNFDYTRYPGSDFDDSKSYALYGKGKNKDNWRRENINQFVHDFYDMAKSIKPLIKVGAAPIGTYKNVPPYGNMTAYGSVYQDACEWMQSGKQDLLVPQMYWNEKYGFSPNMTTWVDNSAGRQLVVGLAPYKMTDGSNNWDVSVVTDQIEKVRAKAGMSGLCFFRTDHVIGSDSKTKELYSQIQNNYFKSPAHIVPMSYNGITKPNKPAEVKYTNQSGVYKITWATPNQADAPIKYYCVYAASGQDADINDIKNCVGFAIKGNEFSYTPAAGESDLRFVVTAFDVNYYESDPAKALSGVEEPDNAINLNITINVGNIAVKGENISGAMLVDISGRTLSEAVSSNNYAQLSTQSLTGGVYIIVVKHHNGTTTTRKVIL